MSELNRDGKLFLKSFPLFDLTLSHNTFVTDGQTITMTIVQPLFKYCAIFCQNAGNFGTRMANKPKSCEVHSFSPHLIRVNAIPSTVAFIYT